MIRILEEIPTAAELRGPSARGPASTLSTLSADEVAYLGSLPKSFGNGTYDSWTWRSRASAPLQGFVVPGHFSTIPEMKTYLEQIIQRVAEVVSPVLGSELTWTLRSGWKPLNAIESWHQDGIDRAVVRLHGFGTLTPAHGLLFPPRRNNESEASVDEELLDRYSIGELLDVPDDERLLYAEAVLRCWNRERAVFDHPREIALGEIAHMGTPSARLYHRAPSILDALVEGLPHAAALEMVTALLTAPDTVSIPGRALLVVDRRA